MTTIRRITVSQIEGNNANSTNTDEIRPFGETAFYLDTSGNTDRLTLMMFDGVRTHLKSKVMSPGMLFGSNADSGDGNGFDTIKLIPDATLFAGGSDQYLVVDPTGPNHIHIRAGGTQDDSGAELYLGGEQSYFRVGAGLNPPLQIRANGSNWTFNTDGSLTFPDSTVQTTAWTGTILGNLTVSDQTLSPTNSGDLTLGGGALGHGYVSIESAPGGGNVEIYTSSSNWIADYGNLPANNVANIFGSSVAFGADGHIYTVGGDLSSPIHGFMLKYDEFGALIWQKRVDVPNTVGESLAQAPDGNIWAVFSSYSDSSLAIYEFGTEGNIGRQYNVAAGGKTSDGYDIATDAGGNLLVAGRTFEVQNVFAGVTPSGTSSALGVMRVAASTFDTETPRASASWYMSGTGITGNAPLTEVQVDGGDLLLTIAQSVDFDAPGTWDVTHLRSGDLNMMKISPTDGTLIWQLNIGDTFNDKAYAVAADSGGNAIVAGDIADATTLEVQLSVVKIDPAGTVIWKKRIYDSSPTNVAMVAESVVTDASGNIYVAGRRTSGGSTQGVIAKLNAGGDLQWIKIFSAGTAVEGIAIAYDPVADQLYLSGSVGTVDSSVLVMAVSTAGDLIWQRLLKKSGKSTDQNAVFKLGHRGIAANGDVLAVTGFYFDNNANQFTARLPADGKGMVTGEWDYTIGYASYADATNVAIGDTTALAVSSGYASSVTAHLTADNSYGNLVNPLPDASKGVIAYSFNSQLVQTHELVGKAELLISSVGNIHVEAGSQLVTSGNVLPAADDTYDLGSPSKRYGDLYLSGTVLIDRPAPSTSKGAAGDRAGMVAFSSTYIYYCTADYDGTTDIWSRVALDATAWP